MKIRIATILIFLLIVGTIGCKENTALEYENDPALYFENGTYSQKDSIAHTFFIQPNDQMRDTVLIEIHTMGYPIDNDPPFVLEQANAGQPGAAVAGKHFVAFDDPEMLEHLKIPKGSVRKSFPLIVLSVRCFVFEEVRIYLKLLDNEFFRP